MQDRYLVRQGTGSWALLIEDILGLRLSNAYKTVFMFRAVKRVQENIATVTGRLMYDQKGRLPIVIIIAMQVSPSLRKNKMY